MNKKQIEILKLLGYVDTKEDGAILEHPAINKVTHGGFCPFVWRTDKFDQVLKKHNWNILASQRNNIGRSIIRMNIKD